MSECSLSGRRQGHVNNFYIVDLENFATASRRYTVLPTMSCFADWSKCCHVTLIIIEWSTHHGRPCIIRWNDTRSPCIISSNDTSRPLHVRSRFVYDTYKTMEATRSRHGWVHMFIINRPTVTLQLHNFDFFRTCRTSSFCIVAWQLARFPLTRRIARSLGDSWASCNVYSDIWDA